MPDGPRLPTFLHVPSWTAATQALLSKLSPVERAFAEAFASGLTAAASWRAATGRTDRGPAAHQNGFRIRNRPRVKAAVQACMEDRSVGYRVSRGWLQNRLRLVIERAEHRNDPRSAETILKATLALAKLQGLPIEPDESSASAGPPPPVDGFVRKFEAAKEAANSAARGVPDRRHPDATEPVRWLPPVRPEFFMGGYF